VIGAAPRQRGQQGGVDVEAAAARNVEHGLGKQQAIRRHHHDVEVCVCAAPAGSIHRAAKWAYERESRLAPQPWKPGMR